MMKNTIFAAILGLVAIGSTGCGSPRIVRGITSRADQVKFLYFEGGDTGVIKCQVGPDGALANCRHMEVALED